MRRLVQGLIDDVRLALGTLRASPLRSMLTLLGIVIGVATVVSMMALIEGLRLKVNKDLSALGADVFQVTKWPVGFGRHDWRKYAKRRNFTLDDRDAILEACPLVLAASAEDDEDGQKVATARDETRPNVDIIGATPEYTLTSGVSIQWGRFFGESDDVDARRVAVLGVDVADRLFPGLDPIGQEIRLRNRPFHVVGVLQKRGSFLGLMSLDNQAVIPLSTFHELYGRKRSVAISLQVADAEQMDAAQEQVSTFLRRRRALAPGAENDFELFTNDSMTGTFNELSALIATASFGVCLLSLIVGGIGILNIMLVSVTERTKEIGVRKALGARRERILAQFATEAVVLSLLGGLIGIALGFGVAFLGRWALGFPTSVPAWAVAVSLFMSSATGLVFGIYPAARAARLDPVEAMRAE